MKKTYLSNNNNNTSQISHSQTLSLNSSIQSLTHSKASRVSKRNSKGLIDVDDDEEDIFLTALKDKKKIHNDLIAPASAVSTQNNFFSKLIQANGGNSHQDQSALPITIQNQMDSGINDKKQENNSRASIKKPPMGTGGIASKVDSRSQSPFMNRSQTLMPRSNSKENRNSRKSRVGISKQNSYEISKSSSKVSSSSSEGRRKNSKRKSRPPQAPQQQNNKQMNIQEMPQTQSPFGGLRKLMGHEGDDSGKGMNASNGFSGMKRNTIVHQNSSSSAIQFSLLRTIAKSQTMHQSNNPSKDLGAQEANPIRALSLKVINFTPTDWKRFEGCPLKPGLQFYKIFSHLKPESFSHLRRVLFPDTLISTERLTWLKYDFQEGRYTVRSNDFILPFYFRKTKQALEAYHGSELQWDDPMIIEKRFPQLMNQTYKTVMNEESFQSYLSNGIDQNCVIQSFIRPAYETKPSFYRLIYRNQNIKQSKRRPNYGFLFTSIYKNADSVDENKSKSRAMSLRKQYASLQQSSTQNASTLKAISSKPLAISNFAYNQIDTAKFTKKHIVNIENQTDFEVYKIRNFTVLESRVEEMAQELMQFIHHVYGFRIKQIVIDFIKDVKGNFYLTDVKNFTFDEFDKIRYLQLRSESPQVRHQNRLELLQRASMTAPCQLCKQKYKPTYVQNTITKKMLYKLNAHLVKRGVFMLQHLSKFQNQQEFCKVCDQCNQLVIAELELMEVERLYAIAQNITSKEYNKVKKNEETKIQVADLTTNQLTQWRLMFLIKEIKGVSKSQVLDQCANTGTLYLHLRILDFITTLEVARFTADERIASIESKTQGASNLGGSSKSKIAPLVLSPLRRPTLKGNQISPHVDVSDENNQRFANTTSSNNIARQSSVVLSSPQGIQRKATQSQKKGSSNQIESIAQLKVSGRDYQGSSPKGPHQNTKLNVIYEYQKDDKNKEEEPSLLINKLRVHFFFTLDHSQQDLWRFLQNTEVELRLTDGPYWEGTMIGSCNGFPLQYFNTNQEVQLQPWQYYFFGPINKLHQKQKKAVDENSSQNSHSSFQSNHSEKRRSQSTTFDSLIDFTVSLKRDQKVQISDNVHLYQVATGVLFPENNYFSPLPMPQEWIELVQMFSRERFHRLNPNAHLPLSGQNQMFQSLASSTGVKSAQQSYPTANQPVYLKIHPSNSSNLNDIGAGSNGVIMEDYEAESNSRRANQSTPKGKESMEKGDRVNRFSEKQLNTRSKESKTNFHSAGQNVFGDSLEVQEFNTRDYDGIKNTPFSKDLKQNFSASLKIFSTVQEQSLLSKKLSNMNSTSPVTINNKSRNMQIYQPQGRNSTHDNYNMPGYSQDTSNNNKYQFGKPRGQIIDPHLQNITDDQVLEEQLKLIDAKNQTLLEVNTHYDPKFIYSSTQAVKKLQQIKRQKDKMANSTTFTHNNKSTVEAADKSKEINESSLSKFGGKQDKYKFKNYQIEHETIQEQRRNITYQLKKKNYQAIKDIIDSKKQQMLNIIPDDNMVLERQSSYQKNKILGNSQSKGDHYLQLGGGAGGGLSNQYGEHLTVGISRKNSLKNLRKTPSMIQTKISSDKLDAYLPLYSTELKVHPSSKPHSPSNTQSPVPARSNSIVKQRNSNLLNQNKSVNVFQIVSATYKDYEKKLLQQSKTNGTSLSKLGEIMKLKLSHQISMMSKLSQRNQNDHFTSNNNNNQLLLPASLKADGLPESQSHRMTKNKSKMSQDDDLEEELQKSPLQRYKSLKQGDLKRDRAEAGGILRPLKSDILEQVESDSFTSHGSSSYKSSSKHKSKKAKEKTSAGDQHSNSQGRRKVNLTREVDSKVLPRFADSKGFQAKPPMVKTFYNPKNQTQKLQFKQDRVLSAVNNPKKNKKKHFKRDGDFRVDQSSSLMRTTFFNNNTKLSKISPLKSSIQASNSTLYANFLPWINQSQSGDQIAQQQYQQQMMANQVASLNRQQQLQGILGSAVQMNDGVIIVPQNAIQVTEAITTQNMLAVNQEIARLQLSADQAIDREEGDPTLNDEQQLGSHPLLSSGLQQNQVHPQYVMAVPIGVPLPLPPGAKKISRKRRKQMRQREFKEKYEGILMGELRKGVRSLTRSQQSIQAWDLETSLKKTTTYQQQIIKVYGVEGEKKLIQDSFGKKSLKVKLAQRSKSISQEKLTQSNGFQVLPALAFHHPQNLLSENMNPDFSQPVS